MEQRVPTYATGFVAPKTTALFFDKIWVTDKFAVENSIPDTVRMVDACTNRFGKIYNEKEHHNVDVYRMMDKAILSNRDASNFDVMKYFALAGYEFDEVQDSISDNECKREEKNIVDGINSAKGKVMEILKSNVGRTDGFWFSLNRNEALRDISAYYIKKGIHVVPIYHSLTDFENSMITTFGTDSNKSLLNPDFLKYLQKKVAPPKEINVIEAVIKSIPSIIEEELTWTQVVNFRKDKESFEDLIAFRLWASKEFAGLSQTEITEYISECIINYERALKKHGIQTCIGSLITVLSASSSFLEMLGEGQIGLIAAGFAVAATVMTYSVDNYFQYQDIKNEPIAYIYNISDLVNKH